MKKIAYYGGSFDPVHRGHLAIANALITEFELDEFVFIPAFHAPHKIRLIPTSAFDRFAMLCFATQQNPKIKISRIEVESPDKPFTIETLTSIKAADGDDIVYFVMGADSWMDITTWREWERVLAIANHIVVTRPGIEISSGHVTEDIRERIFDLRGGIPKDPVENIPKVYLTDVVNMEISATDIRRKIRNIDPSWKDDVHPEVANYVEKYQIYK